MLAARTERVRSGRCLPLRPIVLLTLAGTIARAAQGAAPSRRPAVRTNTLPKACLERTHASEKIATLLDTIQDHPTAGAYNTLGVLYAQKDRLACAIPAFEASFQLESQNWEAHYNLAVALLRKGNQPRATWKCTPQSSRNQTRSVPVSRWEAYWTTRTSWATRSEGILFDHQD